jgi:hypothetical protein
LLGVYFVLSEVLRVSKITAAEQKFSFVFRLLDYCCECTSVDVEIVFSKSECKFQLRAYHLVNFRYWQRVSKHLESLLDSLFTYFSLKTAYQRYTILQEKLFENTLLHVLKYHNTHISHDVFELIVCAIFLKLCQH